LFFDEISQHHSLDWITGGSVR